MKGSGLFIYILVMVLVTNLLRVIPVTIVRKPIRNRFLRSFLHYVPYVTLAVMTVPAIIDAAGSPLAGVLALLGGLVAAWFGLGIFPVAIICCLIVLLCGLV